MTGNKAYKLRTAIGAILIEKRKKHAISHEKLAAKAGISRTAISHLESGQRQPTLYISIKLAHALDMSFSELVKQAEKRVK